MVGQSFCKGGVIEVVFDVGVVGVDNLCYIGRSIFKNWGSIPSTSYFILGICMLVCDWEEKNDHLNFVCLYVIGNKKNDHLHFEYCSTFSGLAPQCQIILTNTLLDIFNA
jgi:hypothetical protein